MDKDVEAEVRSLLEEMARVDLGDQDRCGTCRRALWMCDSMASEACSGRKARRILDRMGREDKA